MLASIRGPTWSGPAAPARWEVEALDAAELHRLIEAPIARWIDSQAWQRSVDDEQSDAACLR